MKLCKLEKWLKIENIFFYDYFIKKNQLLNFNFSKANSKTKK